MTTERLLQVMHYLAPECRSVRVTYGHEQGWEHPYRVRLDWGEDNWCEACAQTVAHAMLEALTSYSVERTGGNSA